MLAELGHAHVHQHHRVQRIAREPWTGRGVRALAVEGEIGRHCRHVGQPVDGVERAPDVVVDGDVHVVEMAVAHIVGAADELFLGGRAEHLDGALSKRFKEVKIYRSEFRPLKATLSGNGGRTLMKLVVDQESGRVIGCHMVGDDAAEIIQGIAIAVKCGASKAQFDATMAIHPTASEEFVTMYEPLLDA